LFAAEKILDALQARSPSALISAEGFARIKSLVRTLPNGITYGFGFESRLAGPSGEVDFILRPLIPHGLTIIAGLNLIRGLPTTAYQDQNWEKLRKLSRECTRIDSPLLSNAFCIWIEFDIKQLRQAAPSPSLVFVQLQRASCRPQIYEAIARIMHMSLKAKAMPAAMEKNFLRCIHLMPDRGVMTLFGLPIARRSEAFRVIVGELEADEIPEYVCSAGWKGRAKELQSLILAMGGYADRHSVNFDLTEHGIEKLGIEFGIPQEQAITSDPRWEMILDFLVKQGWCRRIKRDALLEWPKPLTLMHDEPTSLLLRRFMSHIKLSLEPEGRVTGKGYVGVVW
jgi:hypothetical protein